MPLRCTYQACRSRGPLHIKGDSHILSADANSFVMGGQANSLGTRPSGSLIALVFDLHHIAQYQPHRGVHAVPAGRKIDDTAREALGQLIVIKSNNYHQTLWISHHLNTQNEVWNWLLGLTFIVPAAVGLIAFYIWPLIRGIWLSFTEYNLLIPERFAGLDNYKRMVRDDTFWNAVWVTLEYSLDRKSVV